MPSVIALDAMGSDRRPKPEIEGAIQAARHYDVHVLLVGPELALQAELARYPPRPDCLSMSSMPAKSSAWMTKRCRLFAPSATPRCELGCVWFVTAKPLVL